MEGRDILIFVYHEMSVLFTDGGSECIVIFDDADGQEQNILKVDEVPFVFEIFVGAEEPHHILRGYSGGQVTLVQVRREGVGGEQADFCPLDFCRNVAYKCPVDAHAQALGSFGD